MDYLQLIHWNNSPLYGLWMFTTWRWSYIYIGSGLYLLNVLMTMMLSITGTLTCCIQVMAIKIVLLRMSPSPMCVYNQHNASLQSTYLIMLVLLVTIFFLWHTCVVSCHVLYSSMPLYNLACYSIVCYCIVCYCMLYGTYIVIVTVFTVQLSPNQLLRQLMPIWRTIFQQHRR